jgi:hypothetical protein
MLQNIFTPCKIIHCTHVHDALADRAGAIRIHTPGSESSQVSSRKPSVPTACRTIQAYRHTIPVAVRDIKGGMRRQNFCYQRLCRQNVPQPTGRKISPARCSCWNGVYIGSARHGLFNQNSYWWNTRHGSPNLLRTQSRKRTHS